MGNAFPRISADQGVIQQLFFLIGHIRDQQGKENVEPLDLGCQLRSFDAGTIQHFFHGLMRIPFVVYDGFCEKPERIVNITIDNLGGGFQVGSLFKRNGHQQVICISDNTDGVDQERIEGFKKGFGAERTRVMVVPMRKEERWAYYRQKREQFHQISAVFAVSDYYAIDLIRFLNENGFAVPKDVSVAGFDDIPMCEMISPALTTVRQDGALRAKIAIEKLRELKENRDTETTITLPVQLVERESTGQYTTRRD